VSLPIGVSEESYMKVMGKGQKEHIVPFGSSAQKALMKYISHSSPEPLRENRVFLNLDGSQMTETGLKLMLRRLADSRWGGEEAGFCGVRGWCETIADKGETEWLGK
jgi:site-specific recombinase XerD